MENVKFLKETPQVPLIDAIELLPGTEVIFKAHNRSGVPHKILQVLTPCAFLTSDRKSYVLLRKGDYVASYKMAQKDKNAPAAFLVARLNENDLEEVDKKLKRYHNTSLDKEKKQNILPSLDGMVYWTVLATSFNYLSFDSKSLYNSEQKADKRRVNRKVYEIIQVNTDAKIKVCDTKNPQKTYTEKIYKGGIYCFVHSKNAKTGRMYQIARVDFPAIKMECKKKQILERAQNKRSVKLMKLVGLEKFTQKTRN